ncbi:MAG: hypothetical protein QMC81_01665 [Thermoanaerobacterales bacterium]|nr:hypothetical protein [Bacillota bacterium]MDI6906181.1 hypothetical protein [Thermoanaerobacterales bacterium]
MKPDIDRDKVTQGGEPEVEAGAEKGGGDDPNYLGRAWEAIKESVGLDRWTDAQDSKEEKVQ